MSNTTQSPARARITSLLDANSFVEIGAGVTARSTDFNMAEKKAPSDGVITGYGQIDGNPVYVYPCVMNSCSLYMFLAYLQFVYSACFILVQSSICGSSPFRSLPLALLIVPKYPQCASAKIMHPFT